MAQGSFLFNANIGNKRMKRQVFILEIVFPQKVDESLFYFP